MSAPDWLAWLNVLIVPALVMLARISFKLGELNATVKHQGADIKRVDSDVGELRELIFRQG